LLGHPADALAARLPLGPQALARADRDAAPAPGLGLLGLLSVGPRGVGAPAGERPSQQLQEPAGGPRRRPVPGLLPPPRPPARRGGGRAPPPSAPRGPPPPRGARPRGGR